jgi:hypothetical protein
MMTPKDIDELRARRLRECPAMYRGQYANAIAGKASPMRAIKVMCYSCMGWEGTANGGTLKDEVRRCTSAACPLFSYRPGGAKGLSIDAPDAPVTDELPSDGAPEASEGIGMAPTPSEEGTGGKGCAQRGSDLSASGDGVRTTRRQLPCSIARPDVPTTENKELQTFPVHENTEVMNVSAVVHKA